MTVVPRLDWRSANVTGRLLTRPGPEASHGEVAAVAADLRASAERAVDAVAAASRLPVPPAGEVLIVGRAGWQRAATTMTRAMLATLGRPEPGWLPRLAAPAAGVQVGAAFAFLGSRILGQFDPFTPAAAPGGRLLLVAPNIVVAERSMGAEPHGFRQWVCLHEVTHRFQFGAAPWLAGHLLGLMRNLLDDGDDPGALDELTAVMSLIEGHADVTMDRAGVGLVPELRRLRAAVEARRDAPGMVQLVARLLGLRAKREQYRRGATFCRGVIDIAGPDALNGAFETPAQLPALAELADPAGWLRRVAGRGR